ncbi:MAG: 2-C-methyl-D-erythritol 2,4-cyclodiphosphate synthase [Acidobacteriota bacterium]|nr:2-C-methyl-D-erythritol 2,4-cyclodiphosphate synthase [Acidobacteriota bacterium]MDE3043837.1 2-C-methyl-D-erythritol 2,4-cyclodiphosphate synthase [Acidobacteriota bacterium]MDE3107649.1 2-C-methyl-D-erythritol 2,4-cyclodiphosphate synthase [Acidobacteriota bacterium]
MRIGQGVDVHRFSDAPRALWLGLVEIPDAPGLEGHSDADVATHALCDALLGAANLGDLGRHFSDRDPAYKDVSSRELLSSTLTLIRDAGWTLTSGDVTILCERPRLALYLPAMSHELSTLAGAVVSVKATTLEGLGALGRGEGIGATAVVLLEARS